MNVELSCGKSPYIQLKRGTRVKAVSGPYDGQTGTVITVCIRDEYTILFDDHEYGSTRHISELTLNTVEHPSGAAERKLAEITEELKKAKQDRQDNLNAYTKRDVELQTKIRELQVQSDALQTALPILDRA